MSGISRREAVLFAGAALIGQAATAKARQGAGSAPPTKPADLADLSLSDASAMIHSGAVTSSQLTRVMLGRIGALNPALNCYITVMAGEALAQASALDAELAVGRRRGPLHGIPIALKDNIDTRGVRTTAASAMFKDRIPERDAEIVSRLKASGAVILGKTNLDEFAIGCGGEVSYFGPARNPWALDRVTGGSSSGSGAAVASRMAYGAVGTDTAGSVRVPSAWCGIVGLKPTAGLVSIRGIVPAIASLDHCGPMARTAEDVAILLNAMAGNDPLDIFSVPSVREDYVAALDQPVRNFHLSAPESFFDHMDPEVAPIVAAAVDQLVTLTAGIASRRPLWDGDPGGSLGEFDAYHRDLIAKYGSKYMPPYQAWMAEIDKPRAGHTAADEARQREKLMTSRRMIDGVFKDFDLVVAPTTRMTPPKISDALKSDWDPKGSKKVYDFYSPQLACTNTAPFNAFGIPAISVPCGYTQGGLPVGIMIAGPHFSEGKILALAHAYQKTTKWHLKAPELSAQSKAPPISEASPIQ